MSMKTRRNIIIIDEEKCDGCGNCVPACVEGALQIIDGKARLVKESYCDGLGAFLGDCPQGALTGIRVSWTGHWRNSDLARGASLTGPLCGSSSIGSLQALSSIGGHIETGARWGCTGGGTKEEVIPCACRCSTWRCTSSGDFCAR